MRDWYNDDAARIAPKLEALKESLEQHLHTT